MWNKVSPPDVSHSGVVGAAGCQLSLEVAKARSEQRKLYKKFWLRLQGKGMQRQCWMAADKGGN